MKIEQKKDLTRDYSFLNKIKVGSLSYFDGPFIVFMLNEQLKAQTFIRPAIFQQDIEASVYEGGFNWHNTYYEDEIIRYIDNNDRSYKDWSEFWENAVDDRNYNTIKKYINENC